MGGDTLEARVSDPSDLQRAAEVLGDVTAGMPRIDRDQQRLSVPTTGGTRQLIAAGLRFEEAGIALDDLGIRHPSLDDVFLALTGTPTSVADHDQPMATLTAA